MAIGKILQTKQAKEDGERLTAKAEVLLFMASRAQLCYTGAHPELERGVLLCRNTAGISLLTDLRVLYRYAHPYPIKQAKHVFTDRTHSLQVSGQPDLYTKGVSAASRYIEFIHSGGVFDTMARDTRTVYRSYP